MSFQVVEPFMQSLNWDHCAHTAWTYKALYFNYQVRVTF